MSRRDPYAVLDVARDADEATIKRAYRRMASRYHPDRNDDPESAEKFKEGKAAYDLLSDEAKRAAYDRAGHAGVDAAVDWTGAGGAWSDGGFAHVFEEMLGESMRRRATRHQYRGRDEQYTLEITLEEAARGSVRRLRFNAHKRCEPCAGTGAKPGTERVQCPKCKGQGRTRRQDGFFSIEEECGQCGGEGTWVRSRCAVCGGEGRTKGHKTVRVKIPAGVDEGDQIKCAGEGGLGRSGEDAGDLYIEIKVTAHAVFTREGANLRCEKTVSMTDAALGGTVEIPTLGSSVQMQVPEGTQSGQVLRLAGKGVRPHGASATGDLLCTVRVETPKDLDAHQRALLEAFAASREMREGGGA